MALLLVIDDNASVRHLVCEILTTDGHEIMEAADGEIGMRIVRAHTPALVLTDIFMPNKEGIETIREIRALVPSARIIAMTGSDPRHERLYLGAAMALGADATLKKPFRASELRDVVTGLLAPLLSVS